MCTISNKKEWGNRFRGWKMHQGVNFTTNQEKLPDLELWWRKDSEGHLELVDSRLLPFLDHCKWYVL